MDTKLLRSKEIIDKALADYEPYATVAMVSGGDDSLTAYHVAKALGVRINYMLHGNTQTGIPQTTEFVRQLARTEEVDYIEADAGCAYARYVLRKGFFGRGRTAHSYAYHVLKAGPFRKAVSRNIRHGKRNRPVLLLNGARIQESDNRTENMKDGPYRHDPASQNNVWVNVIHHWTKQECRNFLRDEAVQRNPVTCKLGRSGECMCGTMQSEAARIEAASFYPEWGKWLSALEQRVLDRGFTWRWGEHVSDWHIERQNGQIDMFEDWQPMCVSCKG